MPKGRRARGREQNTEGTAASTHGEELETLPNKTPHPRTRAWVTLYKEENRPRTRAWAKQQKERAGQHTIELPGSNALQSSLRETRLRKPRKSSDRLPVPQKDRSQVPASTKRQRGCGSGQQVTSPAPVKLNRGPYRQTKATSIKQRPQILASSSRPITNKSCKPVAEGRAKAKERPASRRQRAAVVAEEPQERRETRRTQSPGCRTWLGQVESVSPERAHQAQRLYTATVPGFVDGSRDGMESSSTSRNTEENESTAKATRSKSVKVSETKLRYHRIQREASTDPKLVRLRPVLKTTLPERLLKDTEDLQFAAQDFLQQIADHPGDSCYSYIDEFSYNFDEGKSKISYPVVNHKYFEADLKRCLAKNEAVLQRTVMIHIINQYWLGEIFDWNSEGQWSQPKDTRLPSREDDDISSPKPDLAISFTLKSFTGGEDDSDPVPIELERCMSPDGGPRCFPFLFMEVKKATVELTEAYMANLHSASQALYNMYSWMVRAGHEKAFYEKVRVFSLVFNAQDLSVRIHRASQLADGNLSFRFDDFSPLARYTKDQACLLIHTILNDYAALEPRPALVEAFTEVTKQEDQRVVSKRKANLARNPSSKRARKSNDVAQQTGQSFAMSNLST